ncbi:MAG: biotin transporter BioY [Lachnospiraceae bacterium]|jgi:biotin transport system substrate-specific component|nr:biotin transporter BioY [Lachnospiraceae bacterium]
MQNSKISIQDICSISIMTAITVVLAQISIPMPLGVPMTMQTFAVTLAGIVLGAKRGAISMIIYVLLGAIGVPVLANFSGGFQHLIGPTGGFLLSFPIMAYLIGIGTKMRRQKGMFLLFLILGTAANYAIGVLMFCILMKASIWTGITACVLPFIPTAIIKAAVASILGLKLQVRLEAALQWT